MASISRAVTISFYNAFPKNNGFKKGLDQLLCLEVNGDDCSLEDLATFLFKYYLFDILKEELYEHVWFFIPNGDHRDIFRESLSKKVPLLSNEMAVGSFDDRREWHASGSYDLTEGSELIFIYDLGTTTSIFVSFGSIKPVDETVEYPRVVGGRWRLFY